MDAGNADYRRADGGGPSDTAYLGAFRRAELLALGGYDERLEANEDFDLCRRYLDAGLEVWVEPGMAVPYEARPNPAATVGQYFAFGRAKTHFWRTTGRRPGSRQLVAIGGAVAGVAVIGAAAVERQAFDRRWLDRRRDRRRGRSGPYGRATRA